MLKTVLRDYQIEARDRALTRLRSSGGFALFCEQRTGKTLITLAVLDDARKDAPYLIIICPKAAIPVWQKAIKQETGRGWFAEIHILNFEKIVNNRKGWYAWARGNAGKFIAVCDESHFIKRRGASRSRSARHLAHFAKYRLALTGTPIAQGIQDAWAQLNFIDPKILGPWDDVIDKKTKKIISEGFNSTYLQWGGYHKHSIVGYKNEEQFNKLFHANSFRVTLRKARKKPLLIRYSKSIIELTRRSREIYEELQEKLFTEVNGNKIKVKNVLACVMKLQQITGGFISSESSRLKIGSEKLEKLHEFVRSLQSRTKFIVVARFLYEIDTIARFLAQSYQVQIVKGGSPYNGKFDCDCIVMQIQSGVAVDMSAADVIILYSTDYSYINFEQARFRILSYDKPNAHYHFLLAKDTVDVQIYDALTRKKNLADLVVDTYRTKGQLK